MVLAPASTADLKGGNTILNNVELEISTVLYSFPASANPYAA